MCDSIRVIPMQVSMIQQLTIHYIEQIATIPNHGDEVLVIIWIQCKNLQIKIFPLFSSFPYTISHTM